MRWCQVAIPCTAYTAEQHSYPHVYTYAHTNNVMQRDCNIYRQVYFKPSAIFPVA